jgi:hypothetical protein
MSEYSAFPTEGNISYIPTIENLKASTQFFSQNVKGNK